MKYSESMQSTPEGLTAASCDKISMLEVLMRLFGPSARSKHLPVPRSTVVYGKMGLYGSPLLQQYEETKNGSCQPMSDKTTTSGELTKPSAIPMGVVGPFMNTMTVNNSGNQTMSLTQTPYKTSGAVRSAVTRGAIPS